MLSFVTALPCKFRSVITFPSSSIAKVFVARGQARYCKLPQSLHTNCKLPQSSHTNTIGGMIDKASVWPEVAVKI